MKSLTLATSRTFRDGFEPVAAVLMARSRRLEEHKAMEDLVKNWRSGGSCNGCRREVLIRGDFKIVLS